MLKLVPNLIQVLAAVIFINSTKTNHFSPYVLHFLLAKQINFYNIVIFAEPNTETGVLGSKIVSVFDSVKMTFDHWNKLL